MMTAIKGILGSKKFWTMVGGTVLLAVTDHLGVSRDVVLSIAGLVGLNLAGIAAQDVGKEKTKMKIEAAKNEIEAAAEGLSPAEKAAALRESAGE